MPAIDHLLLTTLSKETCLPTSGILQVNVEAILFALKAQTCHDIWMAQVLQTDRKCLICWHFM